MPILREALSQFHCSDLSYLKNESLLSKWVVACLSGSETICAEKKKLGIYMEFTITENCSEF